MPYKKDNSKLQSGALTLSDLTPPVLQVEHPVTEGISGVNLPATQVMIGMGIPLTRMPQIRTLYGQDPQGTEPWDFETTKKKKIECHVVAVRITSEDANTGTCVCVRACVRACVPGGGGMQACAHHLGGLKLRCMGLCMCLCACVRACPWTVAPPIEGLCA